VTSSRFNDTIVAIIIFISTSLCFYALREKSISKKQIENMSKDLLALQQAEENLKSMQES